MRQLLWQTTDRARTYPSFCPTRAQLVHSFCALDFAPTHAHNIRMYYHDTSHLLHDVHNYSIERLMGRKLVYVRNRMQLNSALCV